MVPKNPSIQAKIRMPADNIISISDSLKAGEIWKKSVGYDPYRKQSRDGDPIDSFETNEKVKELFSRARNLEIIPEHTPGSCPKCGQIGHLSFQCRNYLLPPEQLENLKTQSDYRLETVQGGFKDRNKKRSKDTRDEDHHTGHKHRHSSRDKSYDRDKRHSSRDKSYDGGKNERKDRNKKQSKDTRDEDHHTGHKHRHSSRDKSYDRDKRHSKDRNQDKRHSSKHYSE